MWGLKKTEALSELIRQINPYIEVKADCVRVTEQNIRSLFAEDDIICEAFDAAENKAVFANEVLTSLPDAILISGSGMAGFSDTNLIRTRRVSARFYLCGDEEKRPGNGTETDGSAGYGGAQLIRQIWRYG